MLVHNIQRHVGLSAAPVIVILGTGPSMHSGIEYLKENKECDLVISIKQSYDYLPRNKRKVIHIFNPYNLKRYKYNEDVTRIYYDDVFAKHRLNQRASDFRFLVSYKQNEDLSESVLINENFSKYELSNDTSHIRPIMPGIFPEALYLALTFKPGKILIFGVDYNKVKNIGNTHVYDHRPVITKILKFVSKPKIIKSLFYWCGFRTEFSHASKLEQDVAIPGITKFIHYIEKSKNCEILGWSHR